MMALGALLGVELPPLMLVAVALLVILIVGTWLRSPSNLPPCPARAYPILGHLPYMAKDPRGVIMDWSKQTGEIFSLYFGTTHVVVLSSYEILKETLVKQADIFTDRPKNGHLPILKCAVNGVVESSGALWKEHRSVILGILRSFGMGKNLMAERIEEETLAYLDELALLEDTPTDLKDVTHRAISNIVCSFLLGKRFEYTDDYFISFVKICEEMIQAASAGSLFVWFPNLKYLPGDPLGAKIITQKEKDFEKFGLEFVQKVQDDETSGINKENVIAHYLKEMNQAIKKGQPTQLSMQGLLKVLGDFMGAGTETTTSTLQWFNLYMLHYPEAQKKVHEEIDQHIGSNRIPKITDKANMTYLNAAIMETQRLASIVPLGLFHRCTEETTLRGYTIPKDTLVMPHLDSVLLSEKIWGDPHVFRPERFIDDKGNLLNPEENVPFSLGRRLCIGQALAKAELFLFIAHVFQRYSVAPAEPGCLPSLDSILGVTRAPCPYKTRLIRRDA